jgi:N-acetylglucosaminyl-diphospho-decaprenol L-rhamnosyltransferase
VGAALLVRREAVARAGLLDARFFMYSEELEWQWRIQRSAARPVVAYLPHAVVVHYEGRSSEQVPAARQIRFQTSKLRLAHQRYGAVFAQALRLFLLACYGWQLALEAIKWLLGHRRPLRQQRIAAYMLVLRDGLPLVDSRPRLV